MKRCPRPERSRRFPAIARDHDGGSTRWRRASRIRSSRRDANPSRLRPGHGGSGASCSSVRRHPPRPTPPTTRSTARRGGRVPSLAGRRARAPAASATGPPESGSAPSHRLDLDVGARLIGVDLQDVVDAQRRAIAVGDDDLDLPHVDAPPPLPVFVSHGGSGALLGGLKAGVPMLAIPGRRPVPERRDDRGARARTAAAAARLSPASVRDAMRRLVDDGRYRDTVASLRPSIDAMPAPEDVVRVFDKEWT